MTDVTKILNAAEQGDPQAAEKLLPLVYDELRRLASAKMAGERSGDTLQATALVHEAYLRLVGAAADQQWNSRGHFFGAAAEAMRRILLNRARDKAALKRGGAWNRVALDAITSPEGIAAEELLAIDELLAQLECRDPVIAQVAKLRIYTGMTIAETSHALDVPRRTVERHWGLCPRLDADAFGV